MHYPDLGSASDWLKENSLAAQPIRSATKIWVVTRHQYGISVLVTQTSFCEGSSGDLEKRRLFSQAILEAAIVVSRASDVSFTNKNLPTCLIAASTRLGGKQFLEKKQILSHSTKLTQMEIYNGKYANLTL